MLIVEEKSKPEFWLSIKPGDTIRCQDDMTVEELINIGKSIEGIDYDIIRIIHVKNPLAQWLFIDLKNPICKKYLMIKIVDTNLDLRIYKSVSDFNMGNRKDLIDSETFWVFQQPENPSDFKYNDLKYTYDINRNDVTFLQKDQGEVEGSCDITPRPSGVDNDLLVSISEYKGEPGKEKNDELMFLEIGSIECNEGGFIEFLEGRTISGKDIEVYKSK